MFDKAVGNGRHPRGVGAAVVGRNIVDLGHDVVTLTELQVQLLAADLESVKSKSIAPLVMLASAGLLALAALPVLLLGLGWLLVNLADWPQWAAFLTVSIAALVLAAGTGWFAWTRIKSAFGHLSRSRDEFAENVRWLKSILRRGRRGSPQTPAAHY